MNKLLKSYFYWTYPRGNIHYDVMVTLILLFIFVTPQFWDFGDKPSRAPGPSHPIQVASDGTRSLLVTISDIDVKAPPSASDNEMRRVLRKAIEPVTGDAVTVLRWETATDIQGNKVWKVWARR
ncbi:MAG TPA: hypothetical protein VL135_05770 [Terracidiphilus sp.]|jgi:hypothetical protein|nr:hypothetical protein [Terracidiphilus sp.]